MKNEYKKAYSFANFVLVDPSDRLFRELVEQLNEKDRGTLRDRLADAYVCGARAVETADRLSLAGQALNGLLHSASYGAELKRIFDADGAIAKAGDERETPQEYTARLAISLADAIIRGVNNS